MKLTEYTLEFTVQLSTGENVEVRIWFSEYTFNFNLACMSIATIDQL